MDTVVWDAPEKIPFDKHRKVYIISFIVPRGCRVSGSTGDIRNGTNRLGQQQCQSQYHCRDCGVYRVLASRREAGKPKRLILKAQFR